MFRIAEKSGRNLRRAILMVNICSTWTRIMTIMKSTIVQPELWTGGSLQSGPVPFLCHTANPGFGLGGRYLYFLENDLLLKSSYRLFLNITFHQCLLFFSIKYGSVLVSCLGVSEGDRQPNCERTEPKTVGGGEKSQQILSQVISIVQHQYQSMLHVKILLTINKVRTRLYELIAHCIPAEVIFVSIQKELVKVKMNMKT